MNSDKNLTKQLFVSVLLYESMIRLIESCFKTIRFPPLSPSGDERKESLKNIATGRAGRVFKESEIQTEKLTPLGALPRRVLKTELVNQALTIYEIIYASSQQFSETLQIS